RPGPPSEGAGSNRSGVGSTAGNRPASGPSSEVRREPVAPDAAAAVAGTAARAGRTSAVSPATTARRARPVRRRDAREGVGAVGSGSIGSPRRGPRAHVLVPRARTGPLLTLTAITPTATPPAEVVTWRSSRVAK